MIRLYDKIGEKLLADITENSIEYIVEEERNGLFELKLIYPAGYNNYNDLIKENILITNATNTLLNQKFRIYNTRKTLGNKIEVYARHISYDLLSDFIENLDIENQSCEYCLNQLFLNSQFSRHFKGVSDIINVQNFKVSRSNPLNAIAGQQGSIIDTFGTGAEILRDNETIKVLNRRGHDNGVVIEYGENMTGFDCEEDTTDLITRIYPYVKKSNNNTEDIITLTEKFVDSPRINNYSHPYIASIDLSDKFEQDEEITQSKLKLETEKYFIKTKCDIPKMNFKINFVLIKKLGLNLCDLVTIKHKLYGIDTQAKVIKAVYNPRIERYESMELGEPKASLGDLISSGGSNDSGNNEEENKPPIIDDNNFPNTLPNIPILSGKAIGLGSIELTWTFENKIFYKYELYASKVKDFSPNVFDLIFKGQVSNFLHVVKPNEVWYYRVRAVNSHGKTTEFSTQVKVETQKNDDFEVYFSGLAVENLVANIFSVDYMKAAIIKGQWVDAKQLSVTDGNGKRTLDIDSFGRVRLNVTELSILSKAVETEESSTFKINNAKAEAINSASVETNKKINNLQVGGRNYTLGTEVAKIIPGENRTNQTYNIGKTNGDILKGKKVTISYEWSVDGTTISGTFKIQTGGEMYYQGGNTNTVSSLNKNGKEVFTCILPTNRGTFQAMYVRMDNFNGTLTIKNFKMELGDKATDYTPAPEDISKEILDITTEKVNQAKADIKVTTDVITQKVNKVESTTTTLNEHVTNHESRITSAEQKITSEAIINTVSATVSQAKNDAINSSNNSTDNKLKNYTTQSEFTELKQDSKDFQFKVTKKGIDNLIKNSSFEIADGVITGKSAAVTQFLITNRVNEITPKDSKQMLFIEAGKGGDAYVHTALVFEAIAGETYTISADTRFASLGSITSSSSYISLGGEYYNILTSDNFSYDWHRVVTTWIAPKQGTAQIRLGFRCKDYSWGAYDNVKVERGIIATPWCPAGNEISEGITSINDKGITVKHSSGSSASFNHDGSIWRDNLGREGIKINNGGIAFIDVSNGEWTNFMRTSYKSDGSGMNGLTISTSNVGDFIGIGCSNVSNIDGDWYSSSALTIENYDGTHGLAGLHFWSMPNMNRNESHLHNHTNYIQESGHIYMNDRTIVFNGFGSETPNWIGCSASDRGRLCIFSDNVLALGYRIGEQSYGALEIHESDGFHSYRNWDFNNWTMYNMRTTYTISNSRTRKYTEAHGLKSDKDSLRYVFKKMQFKNNKLILNIPNEYLGCNYIILNIVKYGKGDVWIREENENCFILESDNDIKVNIEIDITNIENVSNFERKISRNDYSRNTDDKLESFETTTENTIPYWKLYVYDTIKKLTLI